MADKDKIELLLFIEDYLSDAKEGFQEINRVLLAMEKNPGRKEHLDGLLRAFHTLKSSSGMLNFTDVAGFAHECESFTVRLKNREVLIDKETLDFLFEINDTLDALVKDRAATGARKEIPDATRKQVEEIRQKMAYLEAHEPHSRQGLIVIDRNGIIKPQRCIKFDRFYYAAFWTASIKCNKSCCTA